ncbi:MAG: chemotaxis-specific protein-glutamate methyltransferase CheB, partial [Polyangiaceae bacterium]|nr:chemotaxis-specific protein-glutamate methyltransferase CheB [Polyangiaceae bacterium]
MSVLPRTKLLIVDDSAYNRRQLGDVFEAHPDIDVVGKAGDGEEALRLATLLKPDVITLDLEMPKMDGFTFLRILMSKQPTPVIVVSSYAQRENVFKALELGAVDFIAKADQQISAEATELKEQVLKRVLDLRVSKPFRFTSPRPSNPVLMRKTMPPPAQGRPPSYIVAIASSTGGPTALLDLISQIPATSRAAFVIAQHMPDKFTRTFAERLDKRGAIRTFEAAGGETLLSGQAYVCPGRRCMEVVREGVELRLRVREPRSSDKYVPSGDVLLSSVAAISKFGSARTVGVVLTGMGDDGSIGAKAISEAGGKIIVESVETAVVYGMPREVVRTGIPCQELPLPKIGEFLSKL